MKPEAMLDTSVSLRRSGSASWKGRDEVAFERFSPLMLIPIRFEFHLDHWWLWLAEARGKGSARSIDTPNLRRDGQPCESPKVHDKREDLHFHE